MTFIIAKVADGRGDFVYYYERVDPETGKSISRCPTQHHAYVLQELLQEALRRVEDAEENLGVAERVAARKEGELLTMKSHLVDEQLRLRGHVEKERGSRSHLENLVAAMLGALQQVAPELADVFEKTLANEYVPAPQLDGERREYAAAVAVGGNVSEPGERPLGAPISPNTEA